MPNIFRSPGAQTKAGFAALAAGAPDAGAVEGAEDAAAALAWHFLLLLGWPDLVTQEPAGEEDAAAAADAALAGLAARPLKPMASVRTAIRAMALVKCGSL